MVCQLIHGSGSVLEDGDLAASKGDLAAVWVLYAEGWKVSRDLIHSWADYVGGQTATYKQEVTYQLLWHLMLEVEELLTSRRMEIHRLARGPLVSCSDPVCWLCMLEVEELAASKRLEIHWLARGHLSAALTLHVGSWRVSRDLIYSWADYVGGQTATYKQEVGAALGFIISGSTFPSHWWDWIIDSWGWWWLTRECLVIKDSWPSKNVDHTLAMAVHNHKTWLIGPLCFRVLSLTSLTALQMAICFSLAKTVHFGKFVWIRQRFSMAQCFQWQLGQLVSHIAASPLWHQNFLQCTFILNQVYLLSEQLYCSGLR